MQYVQDISRCFDRAHGLAEAAFGDLKSDTAAAIAALQRHYRKGSLPLLALPERSDDLAPIEEIARRYREDFADVVILGTGVVPSPSLPRLSAQSWRYHWPNQNSRSL